MIQLTALNGKEIWINFELIRFIESVPDTLLCFIDGYRLTIQETPSQVAQKIRDFKSNNAEVTQL